MNEEEEKIWLLKMKLKILIVSFYILLIITTSLHLIDITFF